MTGWHVNEGLAVLNTEMRTLFPGIIIGTIGDAAHTAEGTGSDHNPNKYGRVNASDFMIGSVFTPNDAYSLSRILIHDLRTHYVIYNHEIWTSETQKWERYTGSNPHTDHVHESVHDSAYTNTNNWNIGEFDMPTPEEFWGYNNNSLKETAMGVIVDTHNRVPANLVALFTQLTTAVTQMNEKLDTLISMNQVK